MFTTERGGFCARLKKCMSNLSVDCPLMAKGAVSLFVLIAVLLLDQSVGQIREFRIDYEGNQFIRDGEPFRYASGSVHYFRVLQVDWRDRLQKLRAAGLNAVTTYVEWGQHEPSPGVYNFEGDLDLINFIEIAQEEDLVVILRVGPYICAERDFGGFPPWLLTVDPNMNLRKYDAGFMNYTAKWLEVLLPKINPLLYGNGGPIIMVQAENEYGFYDQCDFEYTSWLGALFASYVGDAAVLFTTDGAGDALRCGKIPGVYATVDFGPGTNVTAAREAQLRYEPQGPFVNSEFYPGWLTHWEENWQYRSTESVVKTLEDMLEMDASFNFYMFLGGTNFNLTSGANYGDTYMPQVTSYDYDAPLTEAGDPTEKYFAIRDVIGRYLPLPDVPLPQVSPKGEYDPVEVQYVASVLDSNVREALGLPTISSPSPQTFQELGQSYGFVLYEATVPSPVSDPTLLKVPGIRDRASVSVDGVFAGVLSRAHNIVEIPLLVEEGQTIQIFVENQGMINFGGNDYLRDFKGILGEVTLSYREQDNAVHDWKMTGFPVNNVSWIEEQPTLPDIWAPLPAFFRGEFVLPAGEPLDTFIDMTGFNKGIVYVNGHNLGRYWVPAGPIRTLYLPKSFLKASPGINNLVVLELEKIPSNSDHQVKFVTEHIITSVP